MQHGRKLKQVIDLPEKIKGMFLGVLIGDALGMPAEIYTPEQIVKKFGRLTTYQKSTREGWENKPTGSYTDDTQLTLAVANGLIEGKGLDMDFQAEFHLKAYHNSTSGWGGTTKLAMENLDNGEHWTESAPKGKNVGYGNGMPMKIAPLAAYIALSPKKYKKALEFSALLSDMTHGTPISRAAGQAQWEGLYYCLTTAPKDFNIEHFKTVVINACKVNHADEFVEKLEQAFTLEDDTAIEIIGGKGKQRFSCLTSIPLAYYCFVKNPDSIESVYLAANAGGDTDTNASIVGALLGALFGVSIFPKHLIDTLDPSSKKEVIEVTEQFLNTFPN